ncbi:hypothetical protein PHYBOEH_004737 [Phytophthora boehmeriae]|uniref:EF-hand domain-containing protein n=1 Tax=Phytophthora boehmeriae TaxID=109152 RepID=A0A8T1XB97_9STRA|nr:hypothetical protein PHYBOEH_004737 [Phytophthora boehmeriae]
MPHRKHSNPEAVTGIVGDVGLLRDNTVMLLLDYWTLPHEERLAFFCQIASQASEEDASAILHIFLSNCTTEMFLQVWGALQQGPQFQKMIREAALQLKSTTNNEGPTSTNTEADKQDERDDSVLVAEATDLTKPSRRGSQRNMNKQTRRSTRFMDFHGITDAFDYNKELGIAEEDEDEDRASVVSEPLGQHTSGDNVREDVEAMGMLLTKLSKFVRSLTPLVENEDAAPSNLYRDSYEGMVSTLQYGSRRMEFSEFIYDWHIRKYGLKTLAQRHLLKLIQSLRKYEKKVFQCQLCLRFMAIQISSSPSGCAYYVCLPLGFHEHKFILGLLSRWSLGTFSGGSKHRIALPKQQFKIRIAFAISTVQEALREKFGVFGRGIDTLADRIRAKAIPRDDEFVRENDLLILCVEDFALQRTLLEKVLGAVYLAGDINGDGSLEFDEFASVVTHLSPTVDDRFLQKVFEAAHDFNKPNRISFARFLDVILLERVLSPVAPSAATTGAMRAKNAAATTNGNMGGEVPAVSGGGSQQSSDVVKEVSQDEQEEVYQFELLRETWTHDREAVTHVLQTSITHAPTAKSLTFRVAFLDQLLERRVDSKTAWLCHRQIMREIARYQHLDADQIAGLRHKELQFQKAVRAIRTAQRLSALTPASREAGEDESNLHDGAARNAADSISSPNYTAAVRGISFETPSADMPNVADVAALENELRETFLERADERAIDDYMTAIQHLRRVSVKQQSVLLELHDHMTLLGPEEAVSEVDEENDEESDEDGKEEDNDDQGDGSDGEG